jgi:hypothetical protein
MNIYTRIYIYIYIYIYIPLLSVLRDSTYFICVTVEMIVSLFVCM